MSKEPTITVRSVDSSHDIPEVSALLAVPDSDDILKKSGVYYIWGQIEEGSLKAIHQDLFIKHHLRKATENDPVQLMINSPGGNLDEANALLDLMQTVRMPVCTIGFGTCASAAAMLLAGGTKGLRIVAPSTVVMIHTYSWGAAGKHHELVAHRAAQDSEYEREVEFWLKNSKYKTRKQVEQNLLKKQDVWMTAKEALAHGIVDELGTMFSR